MTLTSSIVTPFFTHDDGIFKTWNETFAELYPQIRIGMQVTNIFPQWKSNLTHQFMTDMEGDMIQIDQLEDKHSGNIHVIKQTSDDVLQLTRYSDIIQSLVDMGQYKTIIVDKFKTAEFTNDQKKRLDAFIMEYHKLLHYINNLSVMSKISKGLLSSRGDVDLYKIADRVNIYTKNRNIIIVPLQFVQSSFFCNEYVLWRLLISLCWLTEVDTMITWSTKRKDGEMLFINLISHSPLLNTIGSSDVTLIQYICREFGWVYHIRENEQVLGIC